MDSATIAAALGDARREGRAWRCRCPLHGGRSLVLRDGDQGHLLVTCWGGCDRLAVLAELRARHLLRLGHDQRLHHVHRVGGDLADDQRLHRLPRVGDDRDVARARRIWDAAADASTSPVVRYLAGRGIVLDCCPGVLRWLPRCRRADRTYMSAMVALVEHVERGFVGIQRTYLTLDHQRHDRAALGPIGGGAVRLGMPRAGEWLAIAEGIETALSIAVACALPTWAALSAFGIRALILPQEATHIVICADNDVNGTGERAAHAAAQRWLAEGRRVRIAMPVDRGSDFNDLLTGHVPAKIDEAAHVR